MKKLFFIVLMLTQMQVFAQDSITTQITETERIIDKYSDKATEAIKGLAIALEVPAKHVYKILIKQQLIYSIGWILVFVVGITASFFLIKFVKYAIEQNWDETAIIMSVFLGGGCVALMIASIMNFDVILTGIINPEYGAIQEISKLIK